MFDIQEIYNWLNLALDEKAVVGNTYRFPSIHLRSYGLSLLIIPLEQWKNVSPADDYLKSFMENITDEKWIVVWEDIWINRKDIVKSRLQAFVGQSSRIHGRECTVESMDSKEAAAFLESHHLMGHTPAKFRYKLMHQQQVAAVATFGRSIPVSRFGKKVESFELIRFCHRKRHHVSGGLSKLLSHFRKSIGPDDIFTSVDLEWSDGSGYARIGFRPIERTPPLCFFVDGNLIRHRSKTEGIRVCNAGNLRMALTYV